MAVEKFDQKFKAEDFAEKFGVHVKTILRATSNNPHVSDWHPEPLSIREVAKAFEADKEVILSVMKNREQLIDAETAAEMLGISIRRFHQKRAESKEPAVAAKHGRTVRYALSSVVALSDL